MIARAASFDALEAAEAVGGHLDAGGARRFSGIATDTRDPLEGRLFVALVGARFDAHDFLGRAVEAGAAGLLVSQEGFRRAGGRDAVGADLDVVIVQDTLHGLGALARHHRRRLGTPVLAVTGSNGKTTTKEMLAAILRVETSVLATQGNLNNLVGLPLTLLGLEPEHRVCVAEMGMNALGEIEAMARVAEPVAGLVTNIGPAHIGELGSIENVARAKGELYRGLAEGGVAIVNLDDARARAQADASGAVTRRSFGRSEGADVRLIAAEPRPEGQEIVLEIDGRRLELEIPRHAAHDALNAAAAVATATARPELAPSDGSIVRGLAEAPPLAGRGELRVLGPYLVIDDSYNANAASTVASVSSAARLAGERRLVAVLGEMKELGAFSESGHREVGEALARVGAAVVAAFGPEAAPITAVASGRARHEPEDFDALATWLIGQLEPGDVVLVKGSRAARMERVIARIEEIT